MISYRQEFIDIVKDEALPLLRDHYSEVYTAKEVFDLQMDWDLYIKLENSGLLKVFTARDDNKLVGYLCVVISPNLHSKGTLTASEDGLFVDKPYRGGSVATGLVEFAEKCLKDDGLKILIFTGSVDKPIDGLMDHLDYSPIETRYKKVL